MPVVQEWREFRFLIFYVKGHLLYVLCELLFEAEKKYFLFLHFTIILKNSYLQSAS